MVTATVLPKVDIEQYLKTVDLRPAYEYFDSELVEKPMGGKKHFVDPTRASDHLQ